MLTSGECHDYSLILSIYNFNLRFAFILKSCIFLGVFLFLVILSFIFIIVLGISRMVEFTTFTLNISFSKVL